MPIEVVAIGSEVVVGAYRGGCDRFGEGICSSMKGI